MAGSGAYLALPCLLVALCGRTHWNGEPERAAVPRDAIDARLPHMLLNNSATNIQAHPQTSPCAALDFDSFGPLEAFPDVFQFLGGESWPCIAHPDAHALRLRLYPCHNGALCW